MKYGLILLLCQFLSPFLYAATQLTISTGEFPPLNSKSFKHYGLMPKIVTEAFKLEGIEVKYKFYPWKLAYQLSELGKTAGTLQWLYSENRAKDHYYSDPILEEQFVWFHLKSYPLHWQSLADLKNVKIGAIRGFTYTSEFYRAIDDKKLNVSFVTKSKQVLDMMLIHRIQAYPELIDVGLYEIINNYPLETAELFTFNPKPFFSAHNHLLISKKQKHARALLDKFNS